jgi:hypothetical protein
MKKVAIFVEGWTEFFFISRLIEEMAGFGKVHQIMMHQHGGSPHLFRKLGSEDVADIELLLMNCCSDGKVKSFILENRGRLVNQGYSLIIGLQDLYPKPLEAWDRFEAGLNEGLEYPGIEMLMALQVMEAEAWFLNESKHYEKIDSALTIQKIIEATNFNPALDCAEVKVDRPAKLLDRIYQIVGLRYTKTQSEIHRTVAALDYDELFVTVRGMSKSLARFLSHLETAGIC